MGAHLDHPLTAANHLSKSIEIDSDSIQPSTHAPDLYERGKCETAGLLVTDRALSSKKEYGETSEIRDYKSISVGHRSSYTKTVSSRIIVEHNLSRQARELPHAKSYFRTAICTTEQEFCFLNSQPLTNLTAIFAVCYTCGSSESRRRPMRRTP